MSADGMTKTAVIIWNFFFFCFSKLIVTSPLADHISRQISNTNPPLEILMYNLMLFFWKASKCQIMTLSGQRSLWLVCLTGLCPSVREPSVTEFIQEQEPDQQWLTLHSDWESLNGTTLHELLVKG